MTDTSAFDDVQVEALRRTGGLKWSLYPDKLGAFVAEMDFGTAPPVVEALHAAVDTGAFGYLTPTMAATMSHAYARWAQDRYGWPVAPDDVRPVADVVQALQIAIEHFSRPGSAVIVPVPSYMPFLTVPLAQGREIIRVPMVPSGDRLGYDLDALDAAFRAGGDLLVLCNPHNPIGRVLERAEMVAVAEVVDRHGGRVFSDEIHAPLVFPGHRHVPYASIGEVTAGHTLTATSASKAWNLPGTKCAQVVLSSDPDRARWSQIAMMAEHGAANLGVVANAAAYSAGAPWLAQVLGYLDGNRRALTDLVAEHLPGVGYRPPEGTYLAWLDCRDVGLADPAAFFLEHAGVALVDGALSGAPGFVRYNFATPRHLVVRAMEQMGAALARG
ncbi:MalY/PatB family protein [Cellulomonas aerilata]|uniref:cysteine-S-conjugate beta-lyase n=1 Tax=Cellulomonas aerilata TaxID=515326 RepID=A0A512D7Y0_9CELL|nr:aminotransferase class I/II-fold pyridoxal phosphate-dependent enzyme [Cellulomonas aerilata]GEO32561.1 aminotransferase [Cellulomonas aerilata]